MFWRYASRGLWFGGAVVYLLGGVLYWYESSLARPLMAFGGAGLMLGVAFSFFTGEPGQPAKWLPAGSWTILTGNTDVGFHHVIVQINETEGRYFRIPISQLPMEEVDEVGGFGGYPREKKTFKVTREGGLARVDIFKSEPTPPTPGFAS